MNWNDTVWGPLPLGPKKKQALFNAFHTIAFQYDLKNGEKGRPKEAHGHPEISFLFRL